MTVVGVARAPGPVHRGQTESDHEVRDETEKSRDPLEPGDHKGHVQRDEKAQFREEEDIAAPEVTAALHEQDHAFIT